MLLMAPQLLYHYTSLESLIKIFNPIQNVISLRFTEISHLNDPLEQKYYLHQLDYCEDDYKALNDQGSYYVFSLSAHQDNLEMWRMYANDATGVSIGFKKNSILGPIQNDNPYFSTIHLVPCCYGKKMIQQLSPNIRQLGNDINYNLSCMFKHECYEHEKEWRLVFRSEPLFHDIHAIQHMPLSVVEDIWLGPKNCLNEEEVRRIVGDSIPIKRSELPYIEPR